MKYISLSRHTKMPNANNEHIKLTKHKSLALEYFVWLLWEPPDCLSYSTQTATNMVVDSASILAEDNKEIRGP